MTPEMHRREAERLRDNADVLHARAAELRARANWFVERALLAAARSADHEARAKAATRARAEGRNDDA